MTNIQRHTAAPTPITKHNLDLYRLRDFLGRSRELHRLQHLLLDSQSHPVVALTGPVGMGKSTLATGAGWATIPHFRDGVVYAAPSGLERFRFYDLVRQLDIVLDSSITSRPPDMWKTSIMELLYQRNRLLILDDTDTAATEEWEQLQAVLRGLRGEDTSARVLIIAEKPTDLLQDLSQDQLLNLSGFTAHETEYFLHAHGVSEELSSKAYTQFQGMPLALRLLQGLDREQPGKALGSVPDLEQTALWLCREGWPQAYRLLELLTSVAGEASYGALRDLFMRGDSEPERSSPAAENPTWEELPSHLQESLQELTRRGLLEHDTLHRRVAVHPRVRQLVATGSTVQSQGWLAAHARYYISIAGQYERLDIENWPELDAEWGNVRQGADWCGATHSPA